MYPNIDFNKVCKIAYNAGKKIEQIYGKDFKHELKHDKSPITEADIEGNKIICDGLSKLDKKYPILSEESKIDWETRSKWESYWLVDPLDGTKEFINKNGEFTVNIAFINNNIPIFGVVYAPILKKIYYAINKKGAYLSKTDDGFNINNSERITAKKINVGKKIKIIGSKSHGSKEFDEWVKTKFNNYELIKAGSSIKFCLLAEGKADIYPRFGLTSEWDIAASCAILNESNCEIKGIDGKITFNKKENILNPFFIAKNKYLKI